MRKIALTVLSILIAAPALLAQEEAERVNAWDALNRGTCQRLANSIQSRIEAYTRMKYRRPVPVFVEPKVIWQTRLKQTGFGGSAARTGLAFYAIGRNTVTIVPWVIGRYNEQNPRSSPEKTREGWLRMLEPILIHELTHAIHHQNFYVVLGGARQASLRSGGLTEEQIDISTVEFLIAEGTAELVSLRVARPETRADMMRHPNRELSHPRSFMRKYVPNGRDPFRVLLSRWGYQDGMDIMHHVTLKVGPRGVRALLYRQPPREVFFQPDIIKTIDLDDPPNPDSILGFLAPEILQGQEIFRAVNPGENRFFQTAHRGNTRAPGCLIGFYARVGDEDGPHGISRYAFFVADPDNPGTWSNEQAASLKLHNPNGVKEYTKPLPRAKGVQARMIEVKAEDGSLYLRAESAGLVVLAHESKPSKTLEERVLLGLRALYIKRPTPHLYDEALKAAREKIRGD